MDRKEKFSKKIARWLCLGLAGSSVLLMPRGASAGPPVSVDAFIGQAGQWAQTVQQDLDCIQQDVSSIRQHSANTDSQTLRLQNMGQGSKGSWSKMAQLGELTNLASSLRNTPLFGSNGLNDPMLWATLFLLKNGSLTGNALGVPPTASNPTLPTGPLPSSSTLPGNLATGSPGGSFPPGMLNPNVVAGNIMGYSGMPIGLEGFPPQILTPLNQDEFSVAQKIASDFASSPDYQAVYNATLSELGQLAGGGQNVPLNGVQLVADGAFLRQALPQVDPTYMAVIWGRTGTEVVLFYANQGAGASYSPIAGNNPYLAPNLGSILAGQQTLYALGKTGGKGPLPVWLPPSPDSLLAAIRNATPGQALSLPLQQWAPTSWHREPLLKTLLTMGRLQRVQAVQNDAWQNAAGTLVTGLTTPHWASFRTQLQANTERIAETRLQEIATTRMLTYLVGENGQEGLLPKLERLVNAAQDLRGSMVDDAAVGEITLLVQDASAAHAQQQQFAHQLSQELEQHRDMLRQLLRERKGIYDSMVHQAALDGHGLARAITDKIHAIQHLQSGNGSSDEGTGGNL